MATSAATGVPPPLQHIPSAKEKKYDRQLRLWGATGQIALEETHILLINNGPGVTGVETLKNLVLPGIGHFTILDSAIVSEADLGVHFFLEDTSLAKYRAEETVKYLQELNPDVTGHAITEPLETWVGRDKVLVPYTLVLLAAPVAPPVFDTIDAVVRALEIPTFYLHSLGFFSHVSLYLPPAFPIVDTHPDPTATTDLRLLKPWPALKEFARKITEKMDQMDSEQFAHIPYVCLLVHYLSQWQESHAGKIPETYKEKTEFRQLVRSGSASEENFDEACAAVLTALNPPTPSSSVREILSAPEAQSLTATSPPFWFIAHAVRQFLEKHGELPLPGAVPDMKARSDVYIQLQNIYKLKAREDVSEVTAVVRALEKDTGRPPELVIDEKDIENFCKGASHISLVRGRPLKVASGTCPLAFEDRAPYLVTEFTNPESLAGLYIAFTAWDHFVASHTDSQGTKVPGADADAYETDIQKLTGIALSLVDSVINEAGRRIEDPEYSHLQETVRQYCLELTRAGGAELHNIASLTGGLIAQEVIKVITRQYVPIDNTCVFDGAKSRTYVLRI